MIIALIIVCALAGEYFLKRRYARYRPTPLRIAAVLGIFAAIIFWFKTEADSNYIAEHCERTVERKCDPAELQAWAVKLMSLPVGASNGPIEVHRQVYVEPNSRTYVDVPHGLYGVWKHQYSPHVSIRDATEREEGYIYLGWGSGVLGHWGLAIGSSTFVPAPSGDKMRLWKPGVYFWRDLH